MTTGKCDRCGTEESMFWYPYAFGVPAVPTPAGTMTSSDCQCYVLCDKCQADFIDFMCKVVER